MSYFELQKFYWTELNLHSPIEYKKIMGSDYPNTLKSLRKPPIIFKS